MHLDELKMAYASVLMFFLRTVGVESVQVKERKRFLSNLQQHSEQEGKLKDILESIERINRATQKKKDALDLCSLPPPTT
jgi:hypothetical protein